MCVTCCTSSYVTCTTWMISHNLLPMIWFWQVVWNKFCIVILVKIAINFGSQSNVIVVAHHNRKILFLKIMLSQSASTHMMSLYYCETKLPITEYLIKSGFLWVHYLSLFEHRVLARLQHSLKSKRTKYYTTSSCESVLGYQLKTTFLLKYTIHFIEMQQKWNFRKCRWFLSASISNLPFTNEIKTWKYNTKSWWSLACEMRRR